MKVQKTSYRTWQVSSESKANTNYTVWFNGGWHCTCQGFQVHMRGCKHIEAVRELIRNKEEQLPSVAPQNGGEGNRG